MPRFLYSPSSVGIVPVSDIQRKSSAHGYSSLPPEGDVLAGVASAQVHVPWQIFGAWPQMVRSLLPSWPFAEKSVSATSRVRILMCNTLLRPRRQTRATQVMSTVAEDAKCAAPWSAPFTRLGVFLCYLDV